MKKTTFSLNAKVAILKIPPEAWDAIIPHSPKVSQALVEYMTAGVIRDIAAKVQDHSMQIKLLSLGKEMASASTKGLVQGWEDGDDICPPWPPSPLGHATREEPDPVPWKIGAVEQVVLADLLLELANVTTHQEYSTQLKNIACAIVEGTTSHLIEDFKKSVVRPRSAKAH